MGDALDFVPQDSRRAKQESHRSLVAAQQRDVVPAVQRAGVSVPQRLPCALFMLRLPHDNLEPDELVRVVWNGRDLGLRQRMRRTGRRIRRRRGRRAGRCVDGLALRALDEEVDHRVRDACVAY